MRPCLLYVLGQAVLATAASIAGTDVSVVRTRNSEHAVDAIARALAPISLGRRDTSFQSNVTSLNSSWTDAILYAQKFSTDADTSAGNLSAEVDITITCATCYILGTAQATFTVAGSSSFSDLVANFTEAVIGDVKDLFGPVIATLSGKIGQDAEEFMNATDAVATEIANVTQTIYSDLKSDLDDIPDIDDILSALDSWYNKTIDAIESDFRVLENITTNLIDKIENVTETLYTDVVTDLESNIIVEAAFKLDSTLKNDTLTAISNVLTTLKDLFESGIKTLEAEFHVDSLALPTVDVDLNMASLPGMPDVSLRFELDGFEMYLELDLALSAGATYTLPLFVSETAMGVSLPNEVTAGVVVAIDLILDIEAEIDISSGFHLKLDDGVHFDIEMFAQNVSSVNFPGAQFEFLPITLSSSSGTVKGALRIELKAGLELDKQTFDVLDTTVTFGAGVEVSVFANVAEFVTNVTGPSSSSSSDSSAAGACELAVVEYFEFNVGACAGATVDLGSHQWGPSPETSVPIFYTTLASACAGTKATSTTSSSSAATKTARAAQLQPRASTAGLTTTTLTSSVVFTGQTCASSGVVNCPASAQVTTTYSTVLTLLTSVASGVNATWPATTASTVANMVAFGTNAKSAVATSGAPTSYDPSDPTNEVASFLNDDTGGVPNKTILGVSLGLGVPVLVAAIAAIVFCCRRKKVPYAPVAKQLSPATPQTPFQSFQTEYNNYTDQAERVYYDPPTTPKQVKTPVVSEHPVAS